MTTIDLNADLGEGDAFDLQLLQVVSSCNIACGGHTGDAESMSEIIRAALANDVAIGAHPSYPDRDGFGRRSHFLAGEELRKALTNQIDRLSGVAKKEGAELAHVKLHGALYGDAANDSVLAEMVVNVVLAHAPGAALVGKPDSALERAADNAGIRFVSEAFVDRAYMPNGTLVPRTEPNAVHTDFNTMTAQAIGLATKGIVTAQDGTVIRIAAKTLCIHGDTPSAAEAAVAVRDVLQASGVKICVAT